MLHVGCNFCIRRIFHTRISRCIASFWIHTTKYDCIVLVWNPRTNPCRVSWLDSIRPLSSLRSKSSRRLSNTATSRLALLPLRSHRRYWRTILPVLVSFSGKWYALHTGRNRNSMIGIVSCELTISGIWILLAISSLNTKNATRVAKRWSLLCNSSLVCTYFVMYLLLILSREHVQ